jgi:type II secretory pathway pseudopilin PulG
MRSRIRTIMVAVLIVGVVVALGVQNWRADRRAAALRLEAIEAKSKVGETYLRSQKERRDRSFPDQGSLGSFGNDAPIERDDARLPPRQNQ